MTETDATIGAAKAAPISFKRRKQRHGSKVERRFAYLFVLPALVLVIVFRIMPLLWGFYLSLTDSNGLGHSNFIGAANYVAIAEDPTFRASMVNTLLLIATLPIWIVLPMLLAILIHQGVPGGKFFRAVYFFPAVLSSVIIGSIFNVVLRYDGSLNAFLKVFGIDAVDWLGSGPTAFMSLIAVELWSTFGMSLLIFLAGLSTVPQDMLEAARLDGAKLWQIWIFVIIPSLRPIIEFVAVVTTIGALTSMFGLIYVLTAGGPGTSTTFPEFLIWLEQGKMNQPGYAAAISMVLFVLMGGLAYLQIRIVILASLMIPVQVVLVPFYRTIIGLGLLNTHVGLIISYTAFFLPFSVYLMTAFYSGLPRELVEAARIDGAKLLQVWWHVMLPMGKPALITLGILNTLYCWNDVLISLLVLQDKRTLMVGIAALRGEYTTNVPLLSAGIVLAAAPIVILYIVFQRQIVSGIAVGAVKG